MAQTYYYMEGWLLAPEMALTAEIKTGERRVKRFYQSVKKLCIDASIKSITILLPFKQECSLDFFQPENEYSMFYPIFRNLTLLNFKTLWHLF
jgi:hypothetical protein